MKYRDWAGIALIVQAVGVVSIRALVETRWMVGSITLGLWGLLLLVIRPRAKNFYDPTVAPYGDMFSGPDMDGGANSLLDKLSDDHD